MAQDSAMHQGTTLGDAASTDVWSAPYTADEYADIYSKWLASNANAGYVLPGYENNLKIQANSPVALNVIVKSGAAKFRGRIYENTADETLTIPAADATNPRLDRVVLRYTAADQEIRLDVLAGTAAATPSLPTLTQTAAVYEISLAYVWVAATATTIADTEIHDERVFAANFSSLLAMLGQRNLIVNSEFMALSASGTAAAPDRWTTGFSGLPTTVTIASKPAQMVRGSAVRMTAGAADRGISQRFFVKASTVYAIKFLVQVTAGDVGQIRVTTNSASPATITRNIRRTGAYIEHVIYYTTESDATIMVVSAGCVNNGDIVDLGQVIVVEGYLPGPFRTFSETIMFNSPLTDANFTGTAYSSSSSSPDLTSSFESTIRQGTHAIIISVEANDSGSAASTVEVTIDTTGGPEAGKLYLRGVPNDIKRRQQMMVMLPNSSLTGALQFRVTIVASGAGTCDLTIQILGIVI